MKLKLKNDELTIFLIALQNVKGVGFNTRLENRICTCILKDFIKKLLKKAVDQKEKISVELDSQTMLMLDFILPQLPVEDIYNRSVIYGIYSQINQACLSI